MGRPQCRARGGAHCDRTRQGPSPQAAGTARPAGRGGCEEPRLRPPRRKLSRASPAASAGHRPECGLLSQPRHFPRAPRHLDWPLDTPSQDPNAPSRGDTSRESPPQRGSPVAPPPVPALACAALDDCLARPLPRAAPRGHSDAARPWADPQNLATAPHAWTRWRLPSQRPPRTPPATGVGPKPARTRPCLACSPLRTDGGERPLVKMEAVARCNPPLWLRANGSGHPQGQHRAGGRGPPPARTHACLCRSRPSPTPAPRRRADARENAGPGRARAFSHPEKQQKGSWLERE